MIRRGDEGAHGRGRDAALLLALLAAGCVRPTEERALRDLEVGRASAGGVAFEVAEGLAAVRAAAPGALRLWAQAPRLLVRAAAAPDAVTGWEITIDNALPDAEARASVEGGMDLPVTPLPATRAAQRRFRVELPAGGVSTLEVVPPDAEEPGRFRVALLSDVQEALDRVGEVFARMNLDPSIRFALGAGDLTRRGTVEQLDKFQRELDRLSVPYFATLGNHELGTDSLPWFDFFGRANFRFVFRGVQFTLVDSGSATVDPLVYDWLEGWLEEGRARVHVVGMHIAPIDPIGVRNGSFASRGEATKLLGRLAAADVDLTLYGHIHSYYAFENAGIPAYISGGGGAIQERFDGIGRHFLVIDVSATGGVETVGVVRVDDP